MNPDRINALKKLSKDLNVLYVEDDKILRADTSEIFNHLFKRVDLAQNGEEGLKLYKSYFSDNKKYYDIVITDIQMPFLDGICMSKAIVKIHKEQKIVIMSAYDEKERLIELINLGIQGFLQKPIEFEQIINVMYNICMTFQLDGVQYFKALTEASIISKSDTKGIITYANDNLFKVTGYRREEMLGHSHNIFRHPENPDSIYKELWKTISSGKVWRGRMLNLNKDGSEFIAESIIIPLFNKDGDIIEYMAIRNDITELVHYKREIFAKEQEKIEEEKIKEAQKSFLVVFTHELKTPLNAIINFTKYIKKQIQGPKELNKEKLLSLLDSVLSNSEDMLENITNILEISKLNTGKLNYHYTLFSMNTLIKSTLEKFDSLINSKNIKIIENTDKEFFINSDEQRVKQIVSNVLSNAIKYGKDEIIISLYANPEETMISIEDNGNGIKDKEAIFNLYTQEDENILERKGQGTGVGLYFVKLLCRDLNITYTVEDRDKGSGSRFVFNFKNRTQKLTKE